MMQEQTTKQAIDSRFTDEACAPIQICMLGNFRLLRAGHAIAIRSGGKTEAFLCHLGLQYGRRVPSEQLQEVVWPSSDPALAHNSLNTLAYNVHKLLGPSLNGVPLVLHEDGYYRLNSEAGVIVDVVCFDTLARAGDQHLQHGDSLTAAQSYTHAIGLYRGDLCVALDMHAVVERERLRVRYLSLLSRVASYAFSVGNYPECLDYAWRLLRQDPCREDAHRLIMQCHVRSGERTAALRHYHHCEAVLRGELGVVPERATTALFEQIQHDPESI